MRFSITISALALFLTTVPISGHWASPPNQTQGQGAFSVDRVQFIPSQNGVAGKVVMFTMEYPDKAFSFSFQPNSVEIEQAKTILALILEAKASNLKFAIYCPSWTWGTGTMSATEYAFNILEAND